MHLKCITSISIPHKFGEIIEDFETSMGNYLIILEMCNVREIWKDSSMSSGSGNGCPGKK